MYLHLYGCGTTTGDVEVELSEGQWTRWTDHPNLLHGTVATDFKVDLDTILADEHLDEFRVRATKDGYLESEHSDTAIIIDTPIKRADGNSRGTRNNEGKVALTLIPIEDIMGPGYGGGEYTFRYRRFANDHTMLGWKPENFASVDTTDPIPSTDLTSEITVPTREKIYAIQFRYRVMPTGSGGPQAINVYAGRDSYAWPSGRAAGVGGLAGKRVGTLPLNYPVDNKTYAYHICEDTFPANKRSEWRDFIRHALGQWELATDYLIDMEHKVDAQGESEPCADYSEAIRVAHDEVINRLVGQQLTDEQRRVINDDIKGIVEATHNWLNINEEDMTLNEIMMIDDTVGIYKDFKVAKISWDLSVSLGFATCALEDWVAACAVPRHGNITDILLRYDEVKSDTLDKPGGDDDVDRSDSLLNTCTGRRGDGTYYYLIHEAGHALGIRDGEGHDDWQGSVNQHPTIRGSVMNYENRNLKKRGRGPALRLPSEPDCSPHPFDVMAIFALYQTIGN